MKTVFANLLIAAALLTITESKSNLLRSENVFGWQHKSVRRQPDQPRTHQESASHDTISPLKRSENVFNWQQTRTQSHKRIANTSSKSTEPINPLNNIKLQPRKKELWLPWPLGELRNDYNRFAEQQKHRPSQQQQQQRIREYYSDDNPPIHNNILKHGKDFAGKLFQRGQSITRNLKREQVQPANYWVKETTTPMATASASMKEEKHKKKAMRGGDVNEEKKWDHEMIMKYVKLQMKVRMRQLGYGE